jgi:glyoxylase-like metal-dependent hydrolase (beta-lactamase superfamily II)
MKYFVALLIGFLATPGLAQQLTSEPLLPAEPARQVAPHVHVLMGWPNIAFVVGARGVLVVDTGLGARNGTLLAREAARLGKGRPLYLATTHFHPEHTSGVQGFPAGTTVIRSRMQQADVDADGKRYIDMFASRSEQMKTLLEGAAIGTATVLFDDEYSLDLGGVTVRMLAIGPAHTRGDIGLFVVEDRVLMAGDVVQHRLAPNMSCAECTPGSWLAALDRLAPLQARLVVPVHTALGDASLIAATRAYLEDLQARARALRAEGKSAAEAGATVAAEFEKKYQGWGLRNIPQTVQKVYDAG